MYLKLQTLQKSISNKSREILGRQLSSLLFFNRLMSFWASRHANFEPTKC